MSSDSDESTVTLDSCLMGEDTHDAFVFGDSHSCTELLEDNSVGKRGKRRTARDIQNMIETLSVDVEMSSVFVCRFCGQAFGEKYDCNQHEAQIHGEPTNKTTNNGELTNKTTNKYFPCKICSRVFGTKAFLDRHLKEAHSVNETNQLRRSSLNSADTSNQPWKRPSSNDKENATNKPNTDYKGFVISYWGKPRFFFPNAPSNALQNNNGSVSGSRNQNNVMGCNNQNVTPNENRVPAGDNQNASKTKNSAVLLKLEELCRLCGSYNERRRSIFSKTRYNLVKIIEDYFPEMKISEDDILPTQICIKCETSLTTWYQFYMECRSANSRFQSMRKMLLNEPDVKAKMEAKTQQEADDVDDYDNDGANDDFEQADDDVTEVGCVNGTSGPTEVELIDVQPDLSSLFTPDSIFSAKERRRIKQKIRARIRLNRLKQRPSACHLCNKSFNLPETLRRHLKTVHSEEKPYKCSMCSSSYNRNHYLTTHIRTVHLNQRDERRPNLGGPHLCHYCGKALASVRSLRVHINCVHTKERQYECNTCHVVFYQKISLQNHLTRNLCMTQAPHERGEVAYKYEEGFPKTCDICGLEFKTAVFYTKHQMKHMTSLTCPLCSVVLHDLNALKEHLELEHPEMTPFQCEVCGKRFKTKNFLQKHSVIHSGIKKFECQYCSTKFLKKKYLINHVRRHTGERPFVCSICDRAFTQVSEMRIHKARHKQATQNEYVSAKVDLNC